MNYASTKTGSGSQGRARSSSTSLRALSKLRHVPDATYDAQQHNHGCMKNTRVDLLADLDTWAQDPTSPPIFWLAGMAGTGKSTVAWSFCERLALKNLLGGSFFCSRTGPTTHSDVTRVIPTLTRLLALRHGGYGAELAEQLDEDSDIAHKSIDRQVKNLLEGAVMALPWSSRPFFILVIDALDECSDQQATADMLCALIDSSPYLFPLKFFVTSRPERYIRGTPLSDVRKNRVVKLHEVKRSVVNYDIGRYIRNRLSALPDFDDMWDGDIRRLTELSDGLFIFASTAISYIGSLNSAQRLRKLTSAVGQPSDLAIKPLDMMYSFILEEASSSHIIERDELLSLREILSCCLAMRTPLSVRALGELLNMSPERLRGSLDLLHAVIYIPDDDSLPRLSTLHASFNDFLSERASEDIRSGRSTGDHVLARGCFIRMSKSDLCFNVSRTPSSYFSHPNPGAVLAKIPESLQYACLHWPHHISAVSTPSSLLLSPYIEQTFCPKFLFWLELLHILGCAKKASALLETAINSVAPPSHYVSYFLRDAHAFIQSSQEAIERSPPHIYLSALPATPPDSLVFKKFFNHFRQLPIAQLHGIDKLTGDYPPTMTSHGSSIKSVAFSPDGTRIVSVTRDRKIRVLDTQTGAPLLPLLTGQCGYVNSIAFSPDGMRIVSSSYTTTIRIWDAQTGKPLLQFLTGHSGSVKSIAFSPDGARIASGSWDKTIRVWDAYTGASLLPPLMGHTELVCSIAFSPNGMRIVSGSWDKTVRVWDAHTGALLLPVLTGHNDHVSSVSFSPDDTRIASGSWDMTIRVWDVQTGAQLLPPLRRHVYSVDSIMFSPDGTRIVSGSWDKTICVWDAHTGELLLPVLEGHSGPVRSVAFSPDGTRILSGSEDGTIRVWDSGDETVRARASYAGPGHLMTKPLAPYLLSVDRAWITGLYGERLFWIPPKYRDCLQLMPCTLIIGERRFVVDFTGCGSAHGIKWTDCFIG